MAVSNERYSIAFSTALKKKKRRANFVLIFTPTNTLFHSAIIHFQFFCLLWQL